MTKLPENLYHATPAANLASILEHGLSGHFTRARPGLISLAGDMLTAIGYVGHQDEGPAVVLAVKLDSLNSRQLRPDREDLKDLLEQRGSERSWEQHSWQESLEICAQCTTSEVIAPEHLRVVFVSPGDGKAMEIEAVPLVDFEMPRPRARSKVA